MSLQGGEPALQRGELAPFEVQLEKARRQLQRIERAGLDALRAAGPELRGVAGAAKEGRRLAAGRLRPGSGA